MRRYRTILLKAYRVIISYLFRTSTALRKGKELKVDFKELNEVDPSYGDWFVHPCVRYVPDGFAGHRWWMVVTPYPKGDSTYENPILYYGEGNTESVPDSWKMVAIVQDTHPEGGYNADGNLYYDGDKLWIIWKENDTNNTEEKSGFRVIMGCSYDGRCFSEPVVFTHNPDDSSMYIASPVLIQVGGKLDMLGVYSPIIGDNCPGRVKKPRGIAVFESESCECTPFHYAGIAEQYYRTGFDFWHIDCFSSSGKYYCLVTPESGSEILLGESENGHNFSFFERPLLDRNGRSRVPYMYKSSGVLIGDDFHLFYPSKLRDGSRVHIFCTTVSFSSLLNQLKQSETR